jgi:PAS domain S-box-containing protein
LLDETFREALRTGSPFALEHRILRPDGSVRVVQEDAQPHFDRDGRLLKYTGSTLDITRFRQVEEALRQSEEHLNSALEAAHAAAWHLNLLDNSLRRSVTHDRIFGYDTLVPVWTVETFFEHVLPEDRPAVSMSFQEAIANESNWEAGCRIRRADGEIRAIKLQGTTQRDRSGKPVSMSGLVTDITGRKQTEDALLRSEERYRTLTEGFQFGVLIYGPHGEIQLSNPKALELLGLSEDQLLGKTSFDPSWNVIHEDGTPFVSPTLPVPQALATGTPVRHVVMGVQRPTARERVWLLVDAIPTRNPDGAVCSFTDITERKLRDELLHQAQKMESVGRLAGGIAHDFNNMLGVVLAYTELAMEGIAPSLPLYNDLEEVRKAATRSADLTRQLLAFARRQTVVPKVLDLNETLTGMLKMLERLLGENIRIHWRPGTQLWPTKIDPSQVDQILANLCVNARDAIADVGKLTIETANTSVHADDGTHAGAVPGDYVRLAVSDNGLGMDSETRARIFEPFFTTKEVGKGTGLGLATVYGIIRQNGGFIDVESELGRGTTFSLYLPRHFGITDHDAQTAVRPALGGHETILLVEDEPAILKVTKRMLEGLGFQVLAASTAVEAIRLATENSHVHLLLADVIMPDRNGRDLANALLALYPNLKRMFMSGYTADVLAQHGVAEDGLNFIQKPFTKAELAAKIRETLDGAPRTSQVHT